MSDSEPTTTNEIPSAADLSLAGERVAFTGTLASMTHRQAHERVAQCGGAATEHVSRQTTILVVGEEGWPLEPDGKPSVKLQQVERWRQEGLEIRVVSESDWLLFVGLSEQREEVHRHYTPAMLSKLLRIDVHQIRRWERMGLIRAVKHVYRLPYFDFQEVAGARRLAELVDAGVPPKEIQHSLSRLQGVLPGIERPLAQLEILAADHEIVYRDPQGRLKTPAGQILFDFDEPEHPATGGENSPAVLALSDETDDRTNWGAADWFDEGRRLADAGDTAAAVECFRMSLMDEPDSPETNFHLADALYRMANAHGALERYHVAAEHDHNYLEAWTQIGCIHAELGAHASALEAFDVALELHPDHPDAHIHKAEVLHQLGRTAEAIPHWRAYLQFDRRGPWAESARSRLIEASDSSP
jgi:tetratricopeptide (TPR) repeat protein